MNLPPAVASIFDAGTFLNTVGCTVVYSANSTVNKFPPFAAVKTAVEPFTSQPVEPIAAVVRLVVNFLLAFEAKTALIARAKAPVAKKILDFFIKNV